jgi:hypothetical protein
MTLTTKIYCLEPRPPRYDKRQVSYPALRVRWRQQNVCAWPTKSELRYAYYGRNKARIFNGAIDSANLKKCTQGW